MLRIVTLASLLVPALSFTTGFGKNVRSSVPSSLEMEISSIDRRDFVTLTSASILTSALSSPAFAEESQGLDLYQDPNVGFEVKFPKTWERSVQSLADRRKIVLFVNPDSGETDKDLLFIAYTPVRDDFTQLGSFGTVDQVAQMTILPKGELAGEQSDNEMILAESKKNCYFFDYTSKISNQPKRHFRTIFTLVQGATGGAGSILVTLTAQTTEDRYPALKSTFDEIINSYSKMKA